MTPVPAMIEASHFILYVDNQTASTAFYAAVLERNPTLDVPGMTEFGLGDGCTLGLMPVAGIRRLLGERLPDPALAAEAPRAELYLRVADPAAYHQRALANGARELSSLLERDWGDVAAYSLDPDGHVLAFAAPVASRHQRGKADPVPPPSAPRSGTLTAAASARDGSQDPNAGGVPPRSAEELVGIVRDAAVEAALLAYEDAGLSGLCQEGRWECAIEAVRDLNVAAVLRKASSPGADAAPDAGERR